MSGTLITMTHDDMIYRKKLVVSQIESLSSTEHGEIFKMLSSDVPFSKNKNGSFFNISHIGVELLEKIERFVSYCLQNKQHIDEYNKKLDECKLKGNLVKDMAREEEELQEDDDDDEVVDEDDDEDVDDMNKDVLRIGQVSRVEDDSEDDFEDDDAKVVEDEPTGAVASSSAAAPVPERKKTMTKFVVAKKRFAKRVTNEQRVEYTVEELLS